MSREKSTEWIFPQIFEKIFFYSDEIIGDFLWLLADGLQKWVITLRCGVFLLHPDSNLAKSILLFKKHGFFSSWWHRSTFLSVLSYALQFEDPGVSSPSFSNAHFRGKMFWLLHLSYMFVVEGEFFQLYNKIHGQGPATGHVYWCARLFSNQFLLSLPGVHSIRLIGRLESFNSSNATG